MAKTLISVSRLKKGDVTEVLHFMVAADRQETAIAFQSAGVTVFGKRNTSQDDEMNINELAQLHYTSGDISGMLKSQYNVPIVFSVMNVIKSIQVTPSEIAKADIQFVD